MPSWTLGDLMSQATKRIGQRSDITASDASFWVNQAYQDFVRDCPEFLSERTHYFSVSSGESLVAIPADCAEIVVISYQTISPGSNRTLRQISPEHGDSVGYFPVGEPQGYFVWGDKIQLFPSANSSANTTHASSGRSYLMRYRQRTTDMSALTAVPSVATENRVAILFKAEVYLNQLVGNIEEATMAEANYATFVASLRDATAKRQMARSRFAMSLPDRRSATPSDSESDSAFLYR